MGGAQGLVGQVVERSPTPDMHDNVLELPCGASIGCGGSVGLCIHLTDRGVKTPLRSRVSIVLKFHLGLVVR